MTIYWKKSDYNKHIPKDNEKAGKEKKKKKNL